MKGRIYAKNMKYLSHSEKQTQKIAEQLTKKLKGGEVIAFTGELGAGKTAFIKGIAKALGIKKAITSPTFVLMKIYPVKSRGVGISPSAKLFNGVHPVESPQGGELAEGELFHGVNPIQKPKTDLDKKSKIKYLCHIDAYRIKNPLELVDIGALEYFNKKDTISVIEWADKAKKILPKKKIEIKLTTDLPCEIPAKRGTRQGRVISRDKKENERNINIEL